MNIAPVAAASVSEQMGRAKTPARSRSLLRLVCRSLLLLAVPMLAADLKWNNSFNETYLSRADGNRITFRVRTPPKVEGQESYPLLVALKGSLRVDPSRRFPFIEVRPSRGNVWGYRATSAFDAMQVIAHMKRNYPVDPDRVYLVGSSAGASGAMHLASQYPDQFAAVVPLVAAGNNYPAANFLNLPVAFHHGALDWTSAICDVRVQFQKMKRLGCPVSLKEYPDAGHSIPRPHAPIMEWLFAQRREAAPVRVIHHCDSPELGRSYWIAINQFADPHLPASVDATVDPIRQIVRITVKNAIGLSLDRSAMPNDCRELRVDRQSIPVSTDRDKISLICRDGHWSIATEAIPTRRTYRAGAAANLLQGEPLLVVYGTGGESAGRIAGLRAAAEKIAGCGGPHYASLRDRFPVLGDSALTEKQASQHNLILIGRPDENSVTKRLLPRLPLAIRGDLLVVGNRRPLRLHNQVLSLLHPNPEHPQRLLYLVSPFTDTKPFSAAAEKHLIGSDGFDQGSQGDLAVQDLSQRIARQMQFDADWKWRTGTADEKQLPDRINDRSDFAMAHLMVMRRQSSADFTLWWGPADKGMWGADFNFLKHYNPAHCTMADLAIERRQVETMIGTVTGAELKQIWHRWGVQRELISFPALDSDALKESVSYRLHIPMDLYIKLGQRRRNLGKPKPGPIIDTANVVTEMFR